VYVPGSFNILYEIRLCLTHNNVAFAFSICEGGFIGHIRSTTVVPVDCMNVPDSTHRLIFAAPNLSLERRSVGIVTSPATLFSPFVSLAFRIYYGDAVRPPGK